MPAGRATYGTSGFEVIPDEDVEEEVAREEAGIEDRIAREDRIDRARGELLRADLKRRSEQARADLAATGEYTDDEVEELLSSMGLLGQEEPTRSPKPLG